MLAVAAAERAGGARVVLGVLLALIAAHGVERQIGRIVHLPALAAVPGGVGDGVRTEAGDAHALRALVPFVRVARRARGPGLRREPAVRPRARGRPAAQRDPRPPEPDALRRHAARRRHDGEGPARDGPRAASTRARRRVARRRGRRCARTTPPAARRASHILDAYLRRAFGPVARFGVYEVRTRRDERRADRRVQVDLRGRHDACEPHVLADHEQQLDDLARA